MATRTLARRLFARALETPGGLKVQTIHAFCTELLHRFPFEANVAARFSVLDDAERTQLLESLTLAVLLQGAETPTGPLRQALDVAMTAGADQTFREVVRGAIAQGDTIRHWIEKHGGKDGAIAALSKALDVDPTMTLAQVEQEIVNGPILPSSEWAAVAAICQTSSANDQKQGERLALMLRLSGREQVETYLKVFIDTKFQPRANLLTKRIRRQTARPRAKTAGRAEPRDAAPRTPQRYLLPRPKRSPHHRRFGGARAVRQREAAPRTGRL